MLLAYERDARGFMTLTWTTLIWTQSALKVKCFQDKRVYRTGKIAIKCRSED